MATAPFSHRSTTLPSFILLRSPQLISEEIASLDIAITSSVGGGVVVLLGNGDGTFQTPVGYPASSPPSVIVVDSLIVADVNGDGNLDLAVGGSEVSVLLGNGNGTFQAPLE